MIYQNLFLIILAALNSFFFVRSMNITKVALKESANSSLPPPKETSYFYRDPQGPGTYEFGYHIEDKSTSNTQFREEKRYPNGTIVGSFGFLRSDGKMAVTYYVADGKGYRTRRKFTELSSTAAPSTQKPTTSTPIQSRTTTTEMGQSSTTEIPSVNLTAGTLPPQLVEEVMDKYQIDLSPDANPSDTLHPDISDIVDGKVPLKTDKKNSGLGFDVVHNFIPNNFPIVPFQLPTELPKKPIDD